MPMHEDSIQLSPVTLRDPVCTSTPSAHRSCSRLNIVPEEEEAYEHNISKIQTITYSVVYLDYLWALPLMYYQLDTVDTCKFLHLNQLFTFFSLGMNSGDFTGDWYDIRTSITLVLLYITYRLVKKKYLWDCMHRQRWVCYQIPNQGVVYMCSSLQLDDYSVAVMMMLKKRMYLKMTEWLLVKRN